MADDLLDRLEAALREASRQLNRITRARLAEFELTLPRFYALKMVGHCGVLTMSALQERLGLAPSTVTELVDDLVEAGLVIRERSHEDRRVVTVALTPAGKRVMARLGRYRREALAQAAAGMTEEKLQALVRDLTLLAEALDRLAGSAGGG